MQEKKTKEADVTRHRTLFFLIGMCLSLSFVYGVINYEKYDMDDSGLDEYVYSEDELEVEQTVQENTPPPPPEAPPVIEIIEDDEIIPEDQPEVVILDLDENLKLDDIIPLPEDDLDDIDGILEFYQVQEKAVFKDGERAMYKFISNNIVVPELALQEGQSGTVLISFVVEKNGRITQVQIDPRSRKVGFGCEEAAMAVVRKMDGKWKAALQRDKPVRMRFSLPVKFQLN
jgi:periplasmic protein TonB